jgi:hypothetical protein
MDRMMKIRNFVSVGSVCVLVVLASAARLALAQGAQGGKASQPDRTLCLDEAGHRFSKNALRKVENQVQECAGDGKWIAGSGDPSKPAQHKQGAACAANDGQTYESGLLRKVADKTQRCDNGKWK